MKQVQIIAFCDGEHEDQVRAIESRRVKLGDGQPVEVDVCRACDERIVAPFLALLENATPVGKAPAKALAAPPTRRVVDQELTCEYCPPGSPTFKNNAGVTLHKKAKHPVEYAAEQEEERRRQLSTIA